MSWEIRGEAVIIDGERIVAIVDKPEDAEMICKAVNKRTICLNCQCEVTNELFCSAQCELEWRYKVKIGGTE